MPEKKLTEQELRAELGGIFEQMRSLPNEAFAERLQLKKRQEEVTRLLREIEIPGADEIEERWTKAAADKTDGVEPPEMIVSPMESGGGGV
jgi:hypothetical protein